MKTFSLEKVVTAAKALDADEEGATATEYIIIIALVAIALISVIQLFGEQIATIFTNSKAKLQDKVQNQDFYQ